MDNIMLKLVAELNKAATKRQLRTDLKSMDNQLSLKILARLERALARRELKKDLMELNNLYINVGTRIKNTQSDKAVLQNRIKELTNRIAEIEVGLKVDKAKAGRSVDQGISAAEKAAKARPVTLNMELARGKIISEVEKLGREYSKLFNNVAATNKYNTLLHEACSISNPSQLKDAEAGLASLRTELKASGLAGQTLKDRWSSLIERSKGLLSTASLASAAFKQVSNAAKSALELDKEMTALSQVQKDITSRDQFTGLLKRWNRSAQEMSVTTHSLISAMKEWSHLGFDLDMAEKLSKLTSVFGQTANLDTKEAVSTLTAAAQAFSQSSDLTGNEYLHQLEAIGDRMNTISSKYSISSEGLAEGLQNTSAALRAAGNDLDESFALMTGANRVIQDTEESSALVKTASFRLQGRVDELKAMGQDTEGVSANVERIQQQIYELTNHKVDIITDDGQLKSTYQILVDIGEVFEGLSNRNQSGLLELVFGRQQSGAGASLLLEYKELEKIKEDSMGSAGSMAEEYAKYMEGTEAHLITLKESLAETYSAFISGDMIKYVADVGTSILNFISNTELLQHSLVALLTLNVGKFIMGFKSGVVSVTQQMNVLGDSLNKVKKLPSIGSEKRNKSLKIIGESTKLLSEKNLRILLLQKELEYSEKRLILEQHNLTKEEAEATLTKMGFTKATNKQTAANILNNESMKKGSVTMAAFKVQAKNVWTSIKTAFMTNPIGISLSAATMLVGVFSSVISNIKQKAEELRQVNMQAADAAAEQTDKITKLYIQYNTLTSIQNRTSSQEEEYRKVINDITVALGNKASALRNLSADTDEYANALKNAAKEELKGLYTTNVKGRMAAEDELKSTVSGITGSKVGIKLLPDIYWSDTYKQSVDMVKYILAGYEGSYSMFTGEVFELAAKWDVDTTDMQKVVEFYNKLDEAQQRLILESRETNNKDILHTDIYQQIDASLALMKEKVEDYVQYYYKETLSWSTLKNGIPTTAEAFLGIVDYITNLDIGEYLREKMTAFLHDDYSELAEAAARTAAQAGEGFAYNTPSDIFRQSGEEIDSFQDRLSRLQGYLKNLPGMGAAERFDMFQDFPGLADKTDDLEQAIKALIQNSLTDLYESLGVPLPETVSDSLDEMVEETVNARYEIENLEETISRLGSLRLILEDGEAAISVEKLKEMVSYGEQYKDLVQELTIGSISSQEFMEQLEGLYRTELGNYQKYMMLKYEDSNTFWKAVILNNGEVIDSFADNYGVDLTNCRTYAEAKLKIENELLGKVREGWSKYYNAQSYSLTAEGARLQQAVNQARNNGISDEVNPYAETLRDILEFQKRSMEASVGTGRGLGEGSIKRPGDYHQQLPRSLYFSPTGHDRRCLEVSGRTDPGIQ